MADNRPCFFCGCNQIQHMDRKKFLIDCEGFDLSHEAEAHAEANPVIHQEFCYRDHEYSGEECDGDCHAFMDYLKRKGHLNVSHDIIVVTQYGIVNIGS